jgi:hypothetical protein
MMGNDGDKYDEAVFAAAKTERNMSEDLFRSALKAWADDFRKSQGDDSAYAKMLDAYAEDTAYIRFKTLYINSGRPTGWEKEMTLKQLEKESLEIKGDKFDVISKEKMEREGIEPKKGIAGRESDDQKEKKLSILEKIVAGVKELFRPAEVKKEKGNLQDYIENKVFDNGDQKLGKKILSCDYGAAVKILKKDYGLSVEKENIHNTLENIKNKIDHNIRANAADREKYKAATIERKPENTNREKEKMTERERRQADPYGHEGEHEKMMRKAMEIKEKMKEDGSLEKLKKQYREEAEKEIEREYGDDISRNQGGLGRGR